MMAGTGEAREGSGCVVNAHGSRIPVAVCRADLSRVWIRASRDLRRKIAVGVVDNIILGCGIGWLLGFAFRANFMG